MTLEIDGFGSLVPTQKFRCGTCGDDCLMVTSTAGQPWVVACETGHPLVPTGEDITIRFRPTEANTDWQKFAQRALAAGRGEQWAIDEQRAMLEEWAGPAE